MSDFVNNKIDGDLMEASDLEAIETASATKADKITSPTTGNVIEQDATGNLVDSGVATSNIPTLSGNNSFSGTNTFTEKLKQTSSGAAGISFTNTSGAADETIWDIDISSTQFVFRTVNDAQTGAESILTVDRTGITVDTVDFTNGTLQSGGVDVALTSGADFTGNVSVSATVPTIKLKDSDNSTSINHTGSYQLVDSVDFVAGEYGFLSGSDNDLSLKNNYTNADVDLETTGTGIVKYNGNELVSTSSGTQTIAGIKTFTDDLTVTNSTPILILRDSDSTGASVTGYVQFQDSGSSQAGYLGYGSASISDLQIQNDITNADIDLITNGTGTVNVNGNSVSIGGDVTGWVRGNTVYIEDDAGAGATTFDVDGVIGAAWESIGPTGSGATNIWTALDVLPSGAKWVRIQIDHEAADSSGSVDTRLYGRVTGSSTGLVSKTLKSRRSLSVSGSGATSTTLYLTETAVLPVDSSGRFDLYLQQVTGTATIDISLIEIGI